MNENEIIEFSAEIATDTELADFHAELTARGLIDAIVEADNEIAGRIELDPSETEQGLTENAQKQIDAWVKAHRTPVQKDERDFARFAISLDDKVVARIKARNALDAASIYSVAEGFSRYDTLDAHDLIESTVSRTISNEHAAFVFTNATLSVTVEICSICKTNPVTSPNADCDFCRFCWATGASEERELETRGLMTQLRELDGVESATVYQTGGGCMMLAIKLDDGRFIGTSAEATIPEDGEPWTVLQLALSEDAFDENDEDRIETSEVESFTQEELVAAVAIIAASPMSLNLPHHLMVATTHDDDELEIDPRDETVEVSDDLIEHAQRAFWAVVAAAHPNVTTGDFAPDADLIFRNECRDAIASWIRFNA